MYFFSSLSDFYLDSSMKLDSTQNIQITFLPDWPMVLACAGQTKFWFEYLLDYTSFGHTFEYSSEKKLILFGKKRTMICVRTNMPCYYKMEAACKKEKYYSDICHNANQYWIEKREWIDTVTKIAKMLLFHSLFLFSLLDLLARSTNK